MKRFLLFVGILTVCAQLAAAGPLTGKPSISSSHRNGLSALHQRAAVPAQRLFSSKIVSSVWFTANGVPSHSAVQGQLLTWAANCLPNDTLQWEIWVDINQNGLFDSTGATKDLRLFVYSVANRDTISGQGLPDTTAVPDSQIVNRMKTGFAPALYWMKAVSLVDGSSAFDSVRVTPLVTPWATVSGHVHVPGDSALQKNLWVEADLSNNGPDFWGGLTDSTGNYVINFDNAYIDSTWRVGGLRDITGGPIAYIAPKDSQLVVTAGGHPGVNFNYQVATDSVTGNITFFGGGIPSFYIDVYAEGPGSRNKSTPVSAGHYQLFFASSDSGSWRVVPWFQNSGYMRPNGVSLIPAGAGHLIQNFVLYPANDSIKGRVTEQGAAPTRLYEVRAGGNIISAEASALIDAQGYYTIRVSNLDSSYWVNMETWDYPIPSGWIVTPSGYNNVKPPATAKNFNLVPATAFIEGQITQDAGDAQAINYNQTGVTAAPALGGSSFQSQPNMSGQYSIPAVPDTYDVRAWVDNGRFLFKPRQQSKRVLLNDTIRNVDFLANYGQCRVEINLVGYPAATPNWMDAGDSLAWPNGYQAGVQVNGPGTYNLYICNSNGWNVWAPSVAGYNASPASYNIGNITHSDTYRGVDTFTYTPSGVAGKPFAELPQTYALEQNAPNPCASATTIRYQLPKPGEVRLRIFNILGQEVRAYDEGIKPAGHFAVRWDGRDGRGRAVSGGIYFYRLQAGQYNAIRKMTVLR